MGTDQVFLKIAEASTRRLAYVLIAVLLLLSSAKAQSLYYGVTVGFPVNALATDDGSRDVATQRFTFGPLLQVGMPRGFGLDLNLLYKRLSLGLASNPSRISSHRLELAPMLRYDFNASRMKPFVHAGMSFNWIIVGSGSDVCAEPLYGATEHYCIEGRRVAELRHSHTSGFVLGAGVGFQRNALQLKPEIRLTRWADRNFGTRDSSLRSNLSQIELLLGIAF